MSRLRRWLNMYQKKVNLDGTIKEEHRQQQIAWGMTQESIEAFAKEFKEEYEQLKALDETDPELWIEYTAWDLFSQEDKQKFNPDGSLKPEYIEYARRIGVSEGYLAQLEYKKKRDVDDFNALSASYAERGINFGESQMRSRISAAKDYASRQKQLGQDIRNGEEISSLPLDVDPDDYYQQHGYNPSRHGWDEKKLSIFNRELEKLQLKFCNLAIKFCGKWIF